jgi:hypothetical protein
VRFLRGLDEIDFVKAQITRLPTRRDQAFTPLRIVVTTPFGTAAPVIFWFELFCRALPLKVGVGLSYGRLGRATEDPVRSRSVGHRCQALSTVSE